MMSLELVTLELTWTLDRYVVVVRNRNAEKDDSNLEAFMNSFRRGL